jgi:hypothetical protein
VSRNIKTFGVVMLIGAAVIAISIWGTNGVLKWGVRATLFLLAGSFTMLWGMQRLREEGIVA